MNLRIYTVIDSHKAFHTLVNRNKYLERNIKGVSIYCKNSNTNTQIDEMLSEKGNLIILKLTNANWEESEALFLLCVIQGVSEKR